MVELPEPLRQGGGVQRERSFLCTKLNRMVLDGLHEIESEFITNLHEIKSYFYAMLHEMKSEYYKPICTKPGRNITNKSV